MTKILKEKALQVIKDKVEVEINALFSHIEALNKSIRLIEEEKDELEGAVGRLETELNEAGDKCISSYFIDRMSERLGQKEEIVLTRDEFNYLKSADTGTFNGIYKEHLDKMKASCHAK